MQDPMPTEAALGQDLDGLDVEESIDDLDEIDTKCFDEYLSLEDDPDLIVARELSSLSVQEREEVFSDVHGLAGEIEETPELLKKSTEQMKSEIAALHEKDTLDLAIKENPRYVLDEDFLLRFLRADRFDPKKAAQRLSRHFDFKLELFGRDKLCRDICQDDLSKKDIEVLYSGFSQIMPLRDRGGSLILVWVSSAQQQNFDDISKLRRTFYMSMAFFEDLETQRKGLISVFWFIGRTMSIGNKGGLIQKMGQLCESLPRLVRAVHYCYYSIGWIPHLTLMKWSVSLLTRLRFKAHYGCAEDCLAALQSHGLPTCVFPMNGKGEWNRENFVQMLEKRRAQERLSKKLDRRVGVPSRNDVLFGRSTVAQCHVGNIRYRSYVDDRKAGYAKASRPEKTKMTEEVVALVKNNGGRFLKDGGTGWVEVDDEVARFKVSHAFRRK